MTKPRLFIVIPCYNEEEVLPLTAPLFLQKLKDLRAAGKIAEDSRVLFVTDGSTDKTWQIIQELHADDPAFFSGVNLAHNAGHQNAVLAGLMSVKELCDMAITMDADLQNPPEEVPRLVEKLREGYDVVVIASSDMSHYIPKDLAEKLDMKLLDRMCALDIEGMYSEIARYDISACGYGPIAATITATSPSKATLMSPTRG